MNKINKDQVNKVFHFHSLSQITFIYSCLQRLFFLTFFYHSASEYEIINKAGDFAGWSTSLPNTANVFNAKEEDEISQEC